MNNKVEGIVLRQIDYRDSDMILSVFSKEYGKISLLARGLKKAKSKNASSCSLFCNSYFHFDYKDHKELHILKNAERKKMFYHIYEDLLKQSCAQIMCECIEKICDESNDYMYELLYKSLQYLNESKDSLLVLSLFFVHCNEYCGVTANVDECVRCKRTSNITTFSLTDGGFVCSNCYDVLKHSRLKEETLRSLRLLHKAGIDDFEILEQYTKGNIEEFKLILSFFEEYSGIHLNSIDFLYKVINI